MKANKAVWINNTADTVTVTILKSDDQQEVTTYPSMAQALAAVQCPANHFVPAFIGGYPTIINAWIRPHSTKEARRKGGGKPERSLKQP
jgi:hypothetical protein